jgi:hypothetical protein
MGAVCGQGQSTTTTMEQMGSVVTIVEKMSRPKKVVETIRYKKVR